MLVRPVAAAAAASELFRFFGFAVLPPVSKPQAGTIRNAFGAHLLCIALQCTQEMHREKDFLI